MNGQRHRRDVTLKKQDGVAASPPSDNDKPVVPEYATGLRLFLIMLSICIGSIPAAAAPNSQSVIVGRAIQGWGISGTMSGSIIVINYVSHPKKPPLLIGIWTGIFMVSTILGPVIGGAFTSGVSWRWCFWINLPLGVPIIFLLLLFLHVPKHIKPAPATWKETILQLDLPGFTLALEWGGEAKPWIDGSVIATLVVWITFFILFVVVDWLQGGRAMVPLRFLKPRVTWANALYNFSSHAAFYQVMFYLPIYFQSIHGQSAIISGVNSLPFLAFFALGAVSSGTAIGKTRHLQPYQLTSALLMTAGMALLYERDVDSSRSWYVGAEVLFGFGVGFGNQVPVTAVQGLSKPEDVPSSTALMFMCQSGSGATFIVVAQSIFANYLLQALEANAPNLDATQVLGTGASEIHNVFSGSVIDAVINAYMAGIEDVFACALAGSALAALVAGLLILMKKLPDHSGKETEENAATA
ncbi:Putative HC-toxin efflux carrier TOXA [Cytospora mali]|uniref:HC-toxin efflux carrier TOXA n=1 Tax=Cytospora mali TaxID=578113 RepID=A0A194UYC2_CYTMA|nr:Putative HC-toxin efflux carrier TOXA [Valsa mali var. pyri (nom. inval.)]